MGSRFRVELAGVKEEFRTSRLKRAVFVPSKPENREIFTGSGVTCQVP